MQGKERFAIFSANGLRRSIRSSRLRKALRSDILILYVPCLGHQFTERYNLQWIDIFLF